MDIAELERLRVKARNRVIIGVAVSIILGLIVCLCVGQFIFIFFIIVFGSIITFALNQGNTKRFISAYKKTIVFQALNNVFSNLTYEPEQGLNPSVLEYTGVMDMGDRYTANDYIAGNYKSVSFVQSDVHIEEEHTSTDSDGHSSTTWVTLFLGRWMVFNFNKPLKSNVLVAQKGFNGMLPIGKHNRNGYVSVSMEDSQFNKEFHIYANCEHDAFYILTPTLMERIKDLMYSTDGDILLCFINNMLHVGISNYKDSFEPKIFRKINANEEFIRVSQDIKLITDFVEKMSLNNDLFKSEV